ncbi:hypothetical protein M1567_00875 [Candidatus Marsarchaeota archaeon]|jgi:hypothetical protein|nr:hypothetical protein [Candidatus Marsarchaeota archaeon]
MESITKKSDYSEKAIFVKIKSGTREGLDSAGATIEKKLEGFGGELVARKSKHNLGTYESVIAVYFESESQMSKALSELKLEALLRSDSHETKIAESSSEKNEMSKKYFKQEAAKLLDDYVYETRWD